MILRRCTRPRRAATPRSHVNSAVRSGDSYKTENAGDGEAKSWDTSATNCEAGTRDQRTSSYLRFLVGVATVLGFYVRKFFSPVTSHKPFCALFYISTTRAYCILDTSCIRACIELTVSLSTAPRHAMLQHRPGSPPAMIIICLIEIDNSQHMDHTLQKNTSLNRWVVWLKEFQNTIIIHQPPHNSIKLQRVTTDTCQQVYLRKFIGNYPVQNWIIASRWMHTNWYLLVSRKVSLLAWWIVRGMIVFDFLNYLFNGPWNCTNFSLMITLTKLFLQCKNCGTCALTSRQVSVPALYFLMVPDELWRDDDYSFKILFSYRYSPVQWALKTGVTILYYILYEVI